MKKRLKLNLLVSLFAVVLFASCGKNDVTNITLNKTTSYLIIGQSDSLIATLSATGDIKSIPQAWTSSNTAVATVTNGIISGVTNGTANITVTAGGKTALCVVTVDDKIQPNLTQGELLYYGDVYSTKDTINHTGSNNFVLYLASAGINMDNLSGNGELLVVELNTSLLVKDTIPAGTYDMMTDLTKKSNFAPFTLVPGYVDAQTNYPWGCWYFGNISDPISNGNMVVTKAANIYTINYELFDDFGVKIYGTFKGALTYVNTLTAAPQAASRNLLKLKSKNTVNKSMVFKRR
jgi:hypothetical protein